MFPPGYHKDTSKDSDVTAMVRPIMSDHIYRLRFYIDNDAPEDYVKRWEDYKYKCENGDSQIILRNLKRYCKLEQNKTLPCLDRLEGGLGGNDNEQNKQIIFRHGLDVLNEDNEIVFDQIISTRAEQWSHEELDDLVFAFIKAAENWVQAECVRGFVEVRHQDLFFSIF